MSAEFLPDSLNQWVCYKNDYCSIWISGDDTEKKYRYFIEKFFSKNKINIDYIKKIINAIDDHFGVIIISKNWLLAAVDCARTMPIFWKKTKNIFTFSPQARNIAQKYKNKIDKDQLLAFQMSGYCINEGTLWQGIENINPGYFIFFQGINKIHKEKYFSYQPWTSNIRSYDILKTELKLEIKKIIKNLIRKADGRTIAIPLSAGLDSRLVASGLRELNYDNVKCYSYGLKNNFESKASQIIAKKLGYKWKFVEINQYKARKYYNSQEYKKFISNVVDGCATTTIQGLYALDFLLKNKFISKNDIIVNGNSGDFISGGHVPQMKISKSKKINSRLIFNKVIDVHFNKHYALWNSLISEKNKEVIRKLLITQIKKNSYNIDNTFIPQGIAEFLEYENRQSKFVNNSQRLFEARGLRWYLPLWDKSFIKFWSGVPLKYKINQKLYKDTLIELDMGKVWGKNYNYKYFVTPKWISLLRYLIKPFFIFLGKNKWHKFEKRYLGYWMDNICGESIFSYRDIINNKNGARHYISWFTLIAENMNLKKNWQNIDINNDYKI